MIIYAVISEQKEMTRLKFLLFLTVASALTFHDCAFIQEEEKKTAEKGTGPDSRQKRRYRRRKKKELKKNREENESFRT